MKRLDGERRIAGGLVATRTSLADARDDAGLNATRLGMMEYARLREDLSEERSINANLVAQLHELRRRATMEEERMHSLFASVRRVHRSLCLPHDKDSIMVRLPSLPENPTLMDPKSRFASLFELLRPLVHAIAVRAYFDQMNRLLARGYQRWTKKSGRALCRI